MPNKALIISLIEQDFKHSRIILELSQVGHEVPDHYSLDILDVVSQLMKVPEGPIEIYWGSIYMSYLNECSNSVTEISSNSIKSCAQNCYDDLMMVLYSGIVL